MLNQVFVLWVLIPPPSMGTHWDVKIPKMQEMKPAFCFIPLGNSKAFPLTLQHLGQEGDSSCGE